MHFSDLRHDKNICIAIMNACQIDIYDRIRIAFNDIFRNLLGIKRGDSISAAFVNAWIISICSEGNLCTIL